MTTDQDSTKPDKVLSKMTGYQVMATIEALENGGITEDGFRLIRANRRLAQEIGCLVHGYKDNQSLRVSMEEQLFTVMPSKSFFCPEDWYRYFKISVSPPFDLPISLSYLGEIMHSPCPFYENKKVMETHFLYFLPVTIGDERVTIAAWQKLFPRGAGYKFDSYILSDDTCWYREYDFAIAHTARFAWYLMLKTDVPNSSNKTFNEQMALKPKNYAVPMLVERIPLHFLLYKKNSEHVDHTVYGRTCDVDPESNHTTCGMGFDRKININGYYDCERDPRIGIYFFRKLNDFAE